MSQTEEDRERRANEIYTDRRIRGVVYCGGCGHDLRTLPYIHRCPECGQEYNARPLKMYGVFLPHLAEPPLREFVLAAVCGVGAFVLIRYGLNPPDIWRLLFGLILATFFVTEMCRGWTKFRQFRMSLRIRRRIERDQD